MTGEPKLWAKKGERITCADGHIIATVARDIPLGDMPKGDEWEGWTQHEPLKGTMGPHVCVQCGAPWFTSGAGHPPYHFEDGWR